MNRTDEQTYETDKSEAPHSTHSADKTELLPQGTQEVSGMTSPPHRRPPATWQKGEPVEVAGHNCLGDNGRTQLKVGLKGTIMGKKGENFLQIQFHGHENKVLLDKYQWVKLKKIRARVLNSFDVSINCTPTPSLVISDRITL